MSGAKGDLKYSLQANTVFHLRDSPCAHQRGIEAMNIRALLATIACADTITFMQKRGDKTRGLLVA